jgi:hypothetical protein
VCYCFALSTVCSALAVRSLGNVHVLKGVTVYSGGGAKDDVGVTSLQAVCLCSYAPVYIERLLRNVRYQLYSY